MVDYKYVKDNDKLNEVIQGWKKNYREVTLPPEYDMYFQENMLYLTIRFARYKFVTKMISKKDRVLEIGCRDGMGTLFLSQFCKHVHAIDIVEEDIEMARKLAKRDNITFELRDFFTLSDFDKYDVIVFLDVIEHLTQEQGEKFLDRTRRLLKPNGMMILGTPSVYAYPYEGEYSKASHIKMYDQAELLGILEKYYGRTLPFSMNDELVHTGFSKLAWYYFFLSLSPLA